MAAPSILRDEAPPLLHGHKARRMESTPRVGTKWLYERGGTVLTTQFQLKEPDSTFLVIREAAQPPPLEDVPPPHAMAND